jgi:hypothetical protein
MYNRSIRRICNHWRTARRLRSHTSVPFSEAEPTHCRARHLASPRCTGSRVVPPPPPSSSKSSSACAAARVPCYSPAQARANSREEIREKREGEFVLPRATYPWRGSSPPAWRCRSRGELTHQLAALLLGGGGRKPVCPELESVAPELDLSAATKLDSVASRLD